MRACHFTLMVVITALVIAGAPLRALADPSLQVVRYQLDSTRRVSVSVYEYRYRADVTNTGSVAAGVAGTLVGISPALSIVDGTVNFGDVAVGATGQRVLRTELLVELSAGATVGQINAGLVAIGGRISAMSAGRNQITVTIPDPGTLTALESKRAQLGALPGFAVVTNSELPVIEALPSAVQNTIPIETRSILHHLAVRGHAAWNLAERLRDPVLSGQRPAIIFDDVFGFGAPDQNYWNYEYPNPVADFAPGFCVRSDASEHHGYEVMSMTAAVFDHSDFRPEDKTVGLFPERLPARVVDHCWVSPGQEYHRLLQTVRELRAQGRNVIVNRSLGNCPKTGCTDASTLYSHLEAQRFIDHVRGTALPLSTSLENDFLLFSASGNELHSLS